MTLDELVGTECPFFGVDNHCFRLGDAVFEAEEDEGDGYRSCMREVKEVPAGGKIFFATPLDTVLVQRTEGEDLSSCGANEGFKLVSAEDGHVWLKFGTANTDDYYPWFVFEYAPREGK